MVKTSTLLEKRPDKNVSFINLVFSKPPKDVLAEYTKRTTFLKGLIQTATLNSPIEKVTQFYNYSILYI